MAEDASGQQPIRRRTLMVSAALFVIIGTPLVYLLWTSSTIS